ASRHDRGLTSAQPSKTKPCTWHAEEQEPRRSRSHPGDPLGGSPERSTIDERGHP
ncbi:hypothetical protein ACJRO7_027075, partial [Eucalyptus globulus]